MPVVRSKHQRPAKIQRVLDVRRFCENRNKVLVLRGVGGLGDILMHRLMFEDFKLLMPDIELHFACPRQYHDAVSDHPFLDRVLDSATVDRHAYLVHYNTTTACGRAEMKVAPRQSPNRSDIWAAHCGLTLTRHNMHVRLTEAEKSRGRELVAAQRNQEGPTVALCPVSAMPQKNLSDQQTVAVVRGLRERGLCPIGLHHQPIECFLKNDYPAVWTHRLREWLAVLHEADLVLSVDSAAFHAAGGMHKPVAGLFTFASGASYGAHYPTAEIVQGPCPVGHRGCYNWPVCPVHEAHKVLPCLGGLATESALAAVDKLVGRGRAEGRFV